MNLNEEIRKRHSAFYKKLLDLHGVNYEKEDDIDDLAYKVERLDKENE